MAQCNGNGDGTKTKFNKSVILIRREDDHIIEDAGQMLNMTSRKSRSVVALLLMRAGYEQLRYSPEQFLKAAFCQLDETKLK